MFLEEQGIDTSAQRSVLLSRRAERDQAARQVGDIGETEQVPRGVLGASTVDPLSLPLADRVARAKRITAG